MSLGEKRPEHRVRVKNRDSFITGSLESKKISNGIRTIVGKLKNPPEGQRGDDVTQAYRFDRDMFTVAQTQTWLKSNEVKFMRFEAASGNPSDRA